MATSSSSESNDPLADLDSFMDGIKDLADEVGAKSKKKVKCFVCGQTTEEEIDYKLKQTCTSCLSYWKDKYADYYIKCSFCRKKVKVPYNYRLEVTCPSCFDSMK